MIGAIERAIRELEWAQQAVRDSTGGRSDTEKVIAGRIAELQALPTCHFCHNRIAGEDGVEYLWPQNLPVQE